ncbi:MAG TPA: hypothetical protein VK211_20270 [Kamptonema sp.]|nr:hypothetical protein [Kamptonema sp.]
MISLSPLDWKLPGNLAPKSSCLRSQKSEGSFKKESRLGSTPETTFNGSLVGKFFLQLDFLRWRSLIPQSFDRCYVFLDPLEAPSEILAFLGRFDESQLS